MACEYGVGMKCMKGGRSKNTMGESLLENPYPKGTAPPPVVHSLKYLLGNELVYIMSGI